MKEISDGKLTYEIPEPPPPVIPNVE
jgi:hypothetical protein